MKRATHTFRPASILSTGAYLPKKVLTNAELERTVDTTDEWITSRTGIKERHLAAEDEQTSDMAAAAAEEALKRANLTAQDIGLILVATATPDTPFPGTACYVQHKIGARQAAAFDVHAACCGFLVGLLTAEQYVASGMYDHVLVIGAEKLSSIVNWTDRNTCVLFGDGAGAAVVGPVSESSGGIIASDIGCDGAQTDILLQPCGGSREMPTPERLAEGRQFLHMSGKEVYRHAVTAMERSAEKVLAQAGLTSDDIAWVVPHQANLRIISAVAERLNVSLDRFILNLDRCGNTSAACIPMALREADGDGRLKPGDKILMVAFGAGLTWASLVMEW